MRQNPRLAEGGDVSLRIEVQAPGAAEVLRPVEVEAGEPGPGEVRVAVVAAGVNRADLWVRSGATPRHHGWPWVPGLELVGTVEAVGKGVKFAIGDRVIAMGQGLGGLRPGGYQARALVPAATLAVLPRKLSRLDGGVLGLPAVSAWCALRTLGIEPGQTVLIHGAGGAVGQMAIRLARAAGADVFASGIRVERFPALRALGADDVIDASKPDWTRGVVRMHRILDLVGVVTFPALLGLAAPGGRIVAAGPPSAELRVSVGALGRGVQISGWSAETLGRDAVQDAVDGLARFVERGLIGLPAVTSFPLADAARAHAAMEAGHVSGRVLLRP